MNEVMIHHFASDEFFENEVMNSSLKVMKKKYGLIAGVVKLQNTISPENKLARIHKVNVRFSQ